MRTAIAVALVCATLVGDARGDAKCKVDQTNVLGKKAEYQSCSAASGYTFDNRNVDAATFCSNNDCKTFWTAMADGGYLQCFQYSASGGDNVLKNRDSGTACFAKYMAGTSPSVPVPAPAPAPVPAPEPAPAPAPASAPSSPTVTATPPSSPSSPGASPQVSPATKAPSSAGGGGGNAGSNGGESNTGANNAGGTGGTSDVPSSATTSSKKPSVSSSDSETPTSGEENGDQGTAGTTTESTSLKSVAGSRGGGAENDAAGRPAESGEATTTGSGSVATGNDSTKKKKSVQSGSGSDEESRGGGGGGGGNDHDSGSGSSSAYMVAGGSGAGVVVGIFGFLYFRKRANQEAEAKRLDGTPNDIGYLPTLQTSRCRASSAGSLHVMGDTGLAPVTIQSKSGFWEDEAITAARIPFEKLKRGTLISRGGFGEVYRGTYRGEPVAIKTLLRERRKDLRQIEKFLVEVKLMTVLEHEHIVHFVGVAWDSLNELCVVSEFMTGGDLRSLLMKYDEDPLTYPRGFSADKIKIALHISHALTYMHSLQPIVLHRDLKSRNILLDVNLNAKLTDFGISRERADSTMTVGVGSSLWIAPEVMTGGHYDERADVFSFGVVLSELDTHRLPYAQAVESGSGGRKLPDTVIVQMMTTSRIAVEFTDEDESPMAQLGRRCVSVTPDDRPSAAEVQHYIHQFWRNFVTST